VPRIIPGVGPQKAFGQILSIRVAGRMTGTGFGRIETGGFFDYFGATLLGGAIPPDRDADIGKPKGAVDGIRGWRAGSSDFANPFGEFGESAAVNSTSWKASRSRHRAGPGR